MAVNARCNSYRQRRAQALGMKDQKGIEGESDVFLAQVFAPVQWLKPVYIDRFAPADQRLPT
ncbi:hypothetical protein HXV84_15485 [Pseudomonas amygdali pv. morsprunorum]|nr:hypothetical protein [Pseudomonas amygdali pv. morsprunorum]